MAKSKTSAGELPAEQQIEQLQAEITRLKMGHDGEVLEGTVLHSAGLPITDARPAFGERIVTFEDITNFNWRVVNRKKKESRRVYVAELNQVVKAETESTPATMITLTMRRAERDATGMVVPREITDRVTFPYYTFDNEFTRRGISPRDVALELWQMRESWGTSFNVYPMTDAEVQVYLTDKMSPEQRAARQAIEDPRRVAELRRQVDTTLATAV